MPRLPSNPFFPAVVLLGCAFVVTILALAASIVGDPESPASQFLELHGGALIAAEVAGILVAGFLALVVDRRQTRMRRASPAVAGDEHEPDSDGVDASVR